MPNGGDNKMTTGNDSFEAGMRSLHHDHFKQKERKAKREKRLANKKKWEGRE